MRSEAWRDIASRTENRVDSVLRGDDTARVVTNGCYREERLRVAVVDARNDRRRCAMRVMATRRGGHSGIAGCLTDQPRGRSRRERQHDGESGRAEHVGLDIRTTQVTCRYSNFTIRRPWHANDGCEL